jgi:hypothetical protein
MPIPKKKLKKSLQKKFGFSKVNKSDHDCVALSVNGKTVAMALFSRSHDDIDDTILGRVAIQLCVRLNYLNEMYSCTKSKADYLSLLRREGRLS